MVHSQMPLRVVMWRGDGGTFLATPDQINPGSETGRSWTIPLIANSHAIHIEADAPFTMEWETSSQSGTGSSSSASVSQVHLVSRIRSTFGKVKSKPTNWSNLPCEPQPMPELSFIGVMLSHLMEPGLEPYLG